MNIKKRIVQIPVVGFIARASYRCIHGPSDWFVQQRLSKCKHPYAKLIADVLIKHRRHLHSCVPGVIAEIEKERDIMCSSNEPLVEGNMGEAGPYDIGVSIQAACRDSKSRTALLFIYLLVKRLRPQNVIELGTNVGISSAYLSAAVGPVGPDARVLTMEASPYRLRIAKLLHGRLGLQNIIYKEGFFAEHLENACTRIAPVEFAFIDGHHQYQPTLDYFNTIWRHAAENAVFVFDDIRWSDGMSKAWHHIQADKRISLSIDLGSIGICVGTHESSPSLKHYVFSRIHGALV